MDSQKSRLIRLFTLYVLGLTLVLLWYLYMGGRRSLAGFANLNPFYIFLAMSSVLPITFLEALRLYFYLSAKKVVSLKKIIQLYLILSPAGYFLSFYSIPLTAFLSWTLFAIPARVLFAGFFYTQVFTALFPALAILLIPLPPSSTYMLSHKAIFLIRAFSFTILSLTLLFLISSTIDLRKKHPQLLKALKAPFTIPPLSFASIALTSLAIFTLQYLSVFVAVRYGLSLQSSHPAILNITGLAGLSSLIPNLPADLGLQEIKGTLFLHLLHYPKENITAAILSFHAFSAFFILILILIALRVDWHTCLLSYQRLFHHSPAATCGKRVVESKNG